MANPLPKVKEFISKVKVFISVAKRSKNIRLIAIIALIAIIPLTVIVAQQQQEIRQRAHAPAATETPEPTVESTQPPVACSDPDGQPGDKDWTCSTNTTPSNCRENEGVGITYKVCNSDGSWSGDNDTNGGECTEACPVVAAPASTTSEYTCRTVNGTPVPGQYCTADRCSENGDTSGSGTCAETEPNCCMTTTTPQPPVGGTTCRPWDSSRCAYPGQADCASWGDASQNDCGASNATWAACRTKCTTPTTTTTPVTTTGPGQNTCSTATNGQSCTTGSCVSFGMVPGTGSCGEPGQNCCRTTASPTPSTVNCYICDRGQKRTHVRSSTTGCLTGESATDPGTCPTSTSIPTSVLPTAIPFRPEDVNRDSRIDTQDYEAWRYAYIHGGSPQFPNHRPNINGSTGSNNGVDLLDFNIWFVYIAANGVGSYR